MKKVVVSLLVVMMALAFSMTGVVSAQCPATTTAACPTTTAAQCTSTATSACCTPCPVVCCPVVKCPTTPCPAVTSCVVTTTCVVPTTVVKEVVVKEKAEKGQVSKGSVESPQTVVDNKVKQSNTASQTATINITTGDKSTWDGDVYINQNQDQANDVSTTVDNTNIDKTTTMNNVNIKSFNTIDSLNNETEVSGNTIGVPLVSAPV